MMWIGYLDHDRNGQCTLGIHGRLGISSESEGLIEPLKKECSME
jgi:hypothetical protein